MYMYINIMMMMITFINSQSSLVLFLKGPTAQIHVDLRSQYCVRILCFSFSEENIVYTYVLIHVYMQMVGECM